MSAVKGIARAYSDYRIRYNRSMDSSSTGAAAVRIRGASIWRWSTSSSPTSRICCISTSKTPVAADVEDESSRPSAVLKDGDYVVFESVAILYYLDLSTRSRRYSV